MHRIVAIRVGLGRVCHPSRVKQLSTRGQRHLDARSPELRLTCSDMSNVQYIYCVCMVILYICSCTFRHGLDIWLYTQRM